MQTFHDAAHAATSYIVALLVLCGAFIADNSNTIIQIGGAVLLLARLIQEIPGAYRVIKKWLTGNVGS